MAYETGPATDYKDLLAKLITFLTSEGSVGTPSYTGTGNGTLTGFKTLPQAPTETWTLSCSNATKVGAANYATTIAADSPVLHWRMNAVSGVIEQDTTVNNLDGTIVGTPTLSSTGLLSVDTDTCITFDGTDDQVKSAANALVQIADADAAIEVLIHPTAITGTRFIAGVGAPGATNADNYLISLWAEDGYLKIMHEYATGSVESVVTNFLLEVNKTYHLVVSRDATNKTYKIYNSGVEVHQWQYVFPPSDGTNSYFCVGLDADSANAFTGRIDEAALYSAQISQATAKAHGEAALGHETFTVTGSVSGAQANAVVGVPYQNTFIDFQILDGATDFIVTDNWTVAVTAGQLGTQAWSINRQERESVFLQGPGLAGADEIFVNIKAYESVASDYYNWEIRGADGYSATKSIADQVNASPPVYTPLLNSSITYWVVATGRFFCLFAKTSTNYHCCYGGFFLPFATPAQYPYPLFIGGSSGTSTARWSDTSALTRAFFAPAASAYARKVSGAWADLDNRNTGNVAGEWHTHPYAGSNNTTVAYRAKNIRDGLSGEYALIPITLGDSSLTTTNEHGVMGELDSCFFISGFGNAAENTVNDGTNNYIVFQDTYLTAIDSYMALRID